MSYCIPSSSQLAFSSRKRGKPRKPSFLIPIIFSVILYFLLLFVSSCLAEPEVSLGTLITKPRLWYRNPLENEDPDSPKRSPVYGFGLGKKSLNSPSVLDDTNSFSSSFISPSMVSYQLPSTSDSLFNYNQENSSSNSLIESADQQVEQQTSIDDHSEEEKETNLPDSLSSSSRLDSLYHIQSPGLRLLNNKVRFPRRPNLYSFGLGKRSFPQHLPGEAKIRNMYSFGLGKRPSGYTGRNMYSFGLGRKRATGRVNDWFSSLGLPQPVYLGDIKRRYSFGLGKRSFPEQESNSSMEQD